MFAILRAGTPELLPAGPFADELGVSHPDNAVTLWTRAELADIGVLPVEQDPVPAGAVVTGYALALSGDHVRQTWTTAPAPAPDLRAYAKTHRDYLIFNSALTVGPYQMVTDGRTQDYVSKACNVASRNPAFVVQDWSLPDGSWITIDAPTMLSIGDKITGYVNGLFSVYRGVLAKIDAGTVIDFAGVDAAFVAGIAAAGIA